MSILLWGLLSDSPVAAVHKALLEQGANPIFLNQQDILKTSIDLHIGATLEGELRLPGQTIDLTQITAVYLRPSDSRDLPSIAASDTEALRHALTVDDILCSWADLTPALVLNRPEAGFANNSKPFQSAWIESLGFRTPETLLTTDPAHALAFWNQHREVIYKSVSGTRSIVARLSPAHLDRLAQVASCPTQFQQYIPGTEYRVHVVGDQVFACSITSTAVDYRYGATPYLATPCDLPEEIAARCVRVAQTMNLPLAGLDLRRTPQGEWFCFEVNPSPAFSSFEDPTHQPIAHAVARLLIDAPSTPPRKTAQPTAIPAEPILQSA